MEKLLPFSKKKKKCIKCIKQTLAERVEFNIVLYFSVFVHADEICSLPAIIGFTNAQLFANTCILDCT